MLSGTAVGLVAAWIAGLVNGLLIARLNVPPFIATLGMFGIARGVGFLAIRRYACAHLYKRAGLSGQWLSVLFSPQSGLVVSGPAGRAGTGRSALPDRYFALRGDRHARAVVGRAPVAFARSRFGLHTYAIGGNKEAALRAGIPVARQTVMIYMLSATFAAIAGLVYNTRFTNGAANAGEALLLDTVAAVVIGGASLFGGAGTVVGTLIGALIISVLDNGLVIMRVNPFWQFIAVGVVIIVAVLIDQAREKLVRIEDINARKTKTQTPSSEPVLRLRSGQALWRPDGRE
ncbi:MAG: ABC transporter permease [Microthrixaceae bacterium]